MSAAEESETFLYFAYGSNMLTRRLTAEDRAPSAVVIGTGYVAGRRLTFHKVSLKDGSGKCDAVKTSLDTDRVYGVVFEVDRREEKALDRAEGCGHGYEREIVEVVTKAGKIEAQAYVATEKASTLRPYHWYKALVVAGAVKHDLPNEYVEWLRTFESVEDPDVARRTEALFGG